MSFFTVLFLNVLIMFVGAGLYASPNRVVVLNGIFKKYPKEKLGGICIKERIMDADKAYGYE